MITFPPLHVLKTKHFAREGRQKLGFRHLNFNVSFNLIFMVSGASIMVSSDTFGGLLVPLGASWGYLGELLGAPLGILGGLLSGKAPKMPPRTPKTSPRPPPETSKRVPGTPKRPPNSSSTSPRGSQRSHPRGHEERQKITLIML